MDIVVSLKVIPVTTSLKTISSKLITKSLRNFDLNVALGETVYLSNEEEQAQVLAEVVSYDSNWLASFRLV